MAATCEGFALAKKLGLDLQTFFDISSVFLVRPELVDDELAARCRQVGPETPADRMMMRADLPRLLYARRI